MSDFQFRGQDDDNIFTIGLVFSLQAHLQPDCKNKLVKKTTRSTCSCVLGSR